MKTTTKKVLRLVCFLLIIATITLWLGKSFYYVDGDMRARVYTYSTIEKDLVDAVYVGTSGVDRFFVTGYAYENHGLSVYPLTVKGLQSWHVLTMLKYAFATQTPDLVMLDTRMFTVNEDTKRMEVRSRYFVDAFPTFSKYRVEAAIKAVKYLGELDVENPLDITYYFNVLRYHDIWQNDIDFDQIKDATTLYQGYNFSKICGKVKEIPVTEYTDESKPLMWFAQEALEEVLDYCNEKGVEVLFVNSPHSEDEETMQRINYLYNYLDQRGIKYLDFVKEDAVERYEFDFSHDFYDKSHTNFCGAVKFTEYVSEYLVENYSFKDHRGDEKYMQWQEAAKNTHNKAEKMGLE